MLLLFFLLVITRVASSLLVFVLFSDDILSLEHLEENVSDLSCVSVAQAHIKLLRMMLR